MRLAALSSADHPGLATKTVEANRRAVGTAMAVAATKSFLAALKTAVGSVSLTTPAILTGSTAAFAVTRYFTGRTLMQLIRHLEGFRAQAERRHHRTSNSSTEHAQHLAPRKLAGDHSRYVIE
jgi:hypothetical protein